MITTYCILTESTSYPILVTELETILNTSFVKMELYGNIVWEKIKKI